MKENVFDYVPLTFYIEVNPHKMDSGAGFPNVMRNFMAVYQLLENARTEVTKIHQTAPAMRTSTVPAKCSALEKLAYHLAPLAYDRKSSLVFTKYTMPLCHFAGYNLWLLKPTGLNRGRGVHVFHDIEKLQEIMLKYSVPHKDEAAAQYA